MKAAHKGRRNEHRTRALLEAAGYSVIRAAGSLGLWDLVGISSTDIVLVQVRTNRGVYGAELEALRSFQAPPNARRFIHIWRDREPLPLVKEI